MNSLDRSVLPVVREALGAYRVGDASKVYDLSALAGDQRQQLTDALGEGDVSLTVSGSHSYRIRETVLPGLWWVESSPIGGDALQDGATDLLEVADVPRVVRAANDAATCRNLSIGDPPVGAMNALPVLAELRHRMKAWQAGTRNHVISFTLLPMNDVDMRTLEKQLGHGPVQARARGIGDCRVELTGHHNLWSVQYFNPGGSILLDTIEVGDVPVALCATQEDIDESAVRLESMLGLA
jgi:hydrogenase-1 operon protein HyaF